MQKSKFDPKKWVFGSQTWPKDRDKCVSKVSQPPKSEFSIIKIEFPMYVVNALASRILCALIFISLI